VVTCLLEHKQAISVKRKKVSKSIRNNEKQCKQISEKEKAQKNKITS